MHLRSDRRLNDSVCPTHIDKPMTHDLRLLASVIIVSVASSPVWADITVTVLGMSNGGARPVLADKNIRVAVGPGRKDPKILQLTTDAEGKVTISDPDATQPYATLAATPEGPPSGAIPDEHDTGAGSG